MAEEKCALLSESHHSSPENVRGGGGLYRKVGVWKRTPTTKDITADTRVQATGCHSPRDDMQLLARKSFSSPLLGSVPGACELN